MGLLPPGEGLPLWLGAMKAAPAPTAITHPVPSMVSLSPKDLVLSPGTVSAPAALHSGTVSPQLHRTSFLRSSHHCFWSLLFPPCSRCSVPTS